jgi:hypothetical protein
VRVSVRSRLGNLVGLGGFEPPTSPLSGVRSNQLSYRPGIGQAICHFRQLKPSNSRFNDQVICVSTHATKHVYFIGGDPAAGSPTATLLRLHPSHESQSGDRPPEG